MFAVQYLKMLPMVEEYHTIVTCSPLCHFQAPPPHVRGRGLEMRLVPPQKKILYETLILYMYMYNTVIFYALHKIFVLV